MVFPVCFDWKVRMFELDLLGKLFNKKVFPFIFDWKVRMFGLDLLGKLFDKKVFPNPFKNFINMNMGLWG